jgi:hypothetical protein
VTLKDEFLPIVEQLVKEAIERFRLEPYPDGPLMSVKLF